MCPLCRPRFSVPARADDCNLRAASHARKADFSSSALGGLLGMTPSLSCAPRQKIQTRLTLYPQNQPTLCVFVWPKKRRDVHGFFRLDNTCEGWGTRNCSLLAAKHEVRHRGIPRPPARNCGARARRGGLGMTPFLFHASPLESAPGSEARRARRARLISMTSSGQACTVSSLASASAICRASPASRSSETLLSGFSAG